MSEERKFETKATQWITDEGYAKIREWVESGMTDQQLCKKMKISKQTLYNWYEKYPMLQELINDAKGIVDDKVENKLLERAMGYKYSEIDQELDKDGNIISSKRKYKEEVPSVSAQIFWLKNRRRTEWRDSQLSYLQEEKLKLENEKERLVIDAMKGIVDKNPALDELVRVIHMGANQEVLEGLMNKVEENYVESETTVSGNKTV